MPGKRHHVCARVWPSKNSRTKTVWTGSSHPGETTRIWCPPDRNGYTEQLFQDGSRRYVYAHERRPHEKWAAETGLQSSTSGTVWIYYRTGPIPESNGYPDLDPVLDSLGIRVWKTSRSYCGGCRVWQWRKHGLDRKERKHGMHQTTGVWIPEDISLQEKNRAPKQYGLWRRQRYLYLCQRKEAAFRNGKKAAW